MGASSGCVLYVLSQISRPGSVVLARAVELIAGWFCDVNTATGRRSGARLNHRPNNNSRREAEMLIDVHLNWMHGSANWFIRWHI